MKLSTRILSIFRRIKLSTQILLTFLIAVKLILGSVLLYQVGLGSIFMETDAIAAVSRRVAAAIGNPTVRGIVVPTATA